MPKFKEGDVVRITEQNIAGRDWVGFKARVLAPAMHGYVSLRPLSSRPDGHSLNTFYWDEPSLELVEAKSDVVYMVFHCNVDFTARPEQPIHIFTDEKDAIVFATEQPGYGFGVDWFVKPVPFN